MNRPCFTLNHATDGIGRRFPQQEGWAGEFSAETAAALNGRLPGASFPTSIILPPTVIFGSAKLTDLISTCWQGRVLGLLVSERVRTIVERFRLPPHHFYPAPIEHRRRAIGGYSWLHLPAQALPLDEETSPEVAEALIAADAVVGTTDLFRLSAPTRYCYCYVSGQLRDSLDAANVTGIRFGTAKIFR